MSDSQLIRQDAADFDDSELANITVADECELVQPEQSAAIPLIPRALPPLRLHSEGNYRRNLGEEKNAKDMMRKTSEGGRMTSTSDSRKKVSETRGVNLPNIELGEPTFKETGLSGCHTAPCITNYTGQLTQTPIGYTLHHSSVPRSANELNQIIFRIQFADPHVSLPPPYISSESAPQSYFALIELPIVGGRIAKASFMLEEVANEFKMNVDEASEALSVWMITDLLEIQLKPHHSPYEIRQCWSHLLRKFTSSTDEDITDDEPMVFIKRQVQLSVKREQEIISSSLLIREVLFNDAYEAFINGRYCCEMEETSRLSGWAMSAVFEPYCPSKHTIEFIRSELDNFVPSHALSTIKGPLVFGRALNRPNSLESIFINAWRESSSLTVSEVHLRFLQQLHSKPYYGAAFFPGTIERPKKKWSLSGSSSDIKVLIGINETYVTVMDEVKREILLVQRIKDCTWQRIDINDDSLKQGIQPSLLLHFPDDDPKAESTTKILQIFGRQGVMMDALMRAMLKISQENGEDDDEDSGAEMSDGHPIDYSSSSHSNGGYCNSTPSTSRPTPSTVPPSSSSTPSSSPPSSLSSSPPSNPITRVPSLTRHHKLCLATFDESGRCLNVQGSLKMILKAATA